MRISTVTIAACGVALVGAIAHAQALTYVHQFAASQPSETVKGMALDATGIYLAGEIGLGNTAYPPGALDAYVRKSDQDGQELWTRHLGGAAVISGILATGSGIYVAGHTGWNIDLQAYFTLPGQPALGFSDAFVRRYDADGHELWTRQFGTDSYDFIFGAAADATGVYVVGRMGTTYNGFPGGQAFLRKYDPDGNEAWTRQLDIYDARSMAGDGSSIYVAGRYSAGNTYSGFLRKYDRSGAEIWTRELDAGTYSFEQVVAANAAGAYVTGTQPDGALARYDPDGTTLSRIRPASGVVAVDEAGLYVAGGVYDAPGQCPAGNGDALVGRYGLDGHEVWTHQFGTWRQDAATAIAVDSTGVYAAGNMGTGVFVARLEKQSAAQTTAGPRIANQCVVNAASLEGGAVAAGEVVSIFGSGLGPAQAVVASPQPGDRVPTTLAGTRVLFHGVAAPLLSVSDRQVNAVAPAAVKDAGGAVDVQVEYQGVRSNAVTLDVLALRPALFREGAPPGQTIVLNADGVPNSEDTPAAAGSLVTVYATGAGPLNPSLPDGQIVSDPPPVLGAAVGLHFILEDLDCGPPLAEFDSDPAFAGGVAGEVNGLVQVQVPLPASMQAGAWTVLIRFGGSRSDDSNQPPALGAATIVVR